MEDEIKALLLRNIALTEENNRLLRNIRTANRLAIIWKAVYLAVLIGSAFLAFNFLQPYISDIQDTYSSVMDVRNSIMPR